MRVLHLPIVICNQPWEMSRGLRKIGVESDYMILDDNDYGWLLPGKPDYNLNVYHRGQTENIKKINRDKKLFLIWAILKYDVFHYHSNISLFDDYSDLKILRRFGKKIVVSSWGCDIRLKKINSQYMYNTCDFCKIGCDDNKKTRKINEFSRYAHIQLVHLPELLEYNSHSKYLIPGLINTDFWQSNPNYSKEAKEFKIFHLFGNSETRGDIRGTNLIRQAVRKLKREGYKIDFLFFDKIPNQGLKDLYQEADLVIEQLRYGVYGITALEAMSMAKPVMAYIRPNYLKYFPGLPIINANPKNIYAKLKWALNNPEQLKIIGRQSRVYVKKNHESTQIARKLYQIYKSLY